MNINLINFFKMKNLYLEISLALISPLFTNVVIAQCDGITLESLTNPGAFEVATLTEADGIRNGPDYSGATIYYPTNSNPPFSSIAIVPGFTALPSSVKEWGPFYASHGIVTIIIGTNSLFDFPEARAEALLDALETIKKENVRVSSPLEGALNLNQLAVSGWSMGGGGAQRAAALDTTIAGVVALCPWLLNPELNHKSPLLIFSGEADPTAPPLLHANIHYNQTPNTTDKVLFEIANGNHSVANTPSGGGGYIGKVALSWLKLYVEKNDCYCPLLTDTLLVSPPIVSKLEKDFECELLDVVNPVLGALANVDDTDPRVSRVYPNPTKNIVNIEMHGDGQYKIISSMGQLLLEGYLTGDKKQIDLSEFPPSMYYLYIDSQIIKLIKSN
jgi:dienelactone hydrolase